MLFRPASITRKLTLICLFFGLTPLLISGVICYQATHEIDKAATVVLETTAANIADKIDRNLFERYGDVQAFGLNRVIDDRSQWYERDPEKNKISQVMDQFIDGYDVYAYSLLVDLEGRPIAVSSKDYEGKALDTAFIFDQNYKDEDWFIACQKGEFTTKSKFTAAGNDTLSGTFIEDVHFDEDCAKILPQDRGLTLAFAAPVYRDGKPIAYWNNHVRFALVEDIVKAEYRALKLQGLSGAEITLVNQTGAVILDFDPSLSGREEPNHDFDNVIFKLNLAQKGVAAVQDVIQGSRGNNYSMHARKQINQGCGYAPLVGASGYPGLPWGVIVRVPEEQVCAQGTTTARQAIVGTAAISALCIGLLGVLVGRRFARPIREVTTAAERVAVGDLSQVVTHHGTDEIGRLAEVFRSLTNTLDGLNTEAQKVVQATQAGDLQVRGDAEKFEGCYRELIDGMNRSVESFIAPTTETLAVLTQVADGNLQTRFTGTYRGEFDRLAVCTNAAVTNLDEMISEVANVGMRLSQVVQQATSDSQVVANSATEQAATLAETAASLEEISSMVKQTADNSHQAKVLSHEAQVAITEGHTAMNRMSEAIQKIKSSSDEQARILKTIDEIAFQTNLLALNAAVEAARAGDAGRGFAVVADEVRRLAQRSADAARTTAAMIDESSANADHGVVIVAQVSSMLSEIKCGGQKTNDLVTEIAAATHEQSQGIHQINTAVTELDKATQAVADSASGVANIAIDLRTQTARLTDLFSRFSITQQADASEPPGKSHQVPATAIRTIERTTAHLPTARKTTSSKTTQNSLVGATVDSSSAFNALDGDVGDF